MPMSFNKTSKNSIDLSNSDEIILQVLEESNKYLESKNEISSKIQEIVWIFRYLEDLLPQTVEKFGSGHMFPLAEANTELESSIELCKLGFYKHALIALRNVLELGLLSVYWDIDGKSHVDIQNWLYSFESTPFSKKTVFPKLKINQNIKNFDDKHKIFDDIDNLFGELSNFVHTKGHYHSSMDLGNANFNRFNEKSLLNWIEYMIKVVKFVVIIHILKYPVALQYTPLDQKFGLNGPAGGFLEPRQSEAIKQFFDGNILKTLQAISDSDDEAIGMTQWINEQPDIIEEEMEAQVEKFEKTHKNMRMVK